MTTQNRRRLTYYSQPITTIANDICQCNRWPRIDESTVSIVLEATQMLSDEIGKWRNDGGDRAKTNSGNDNRQRTAAKQNKRKER